MKNIAISALFAKASGADLKHKVEMRADRDEPAPILIAATYDIGGGKTCTNTVVEAAVAEVSKAQAQLDKTKKDTTTKVELDKQIAAKKAKDAAVLKDNTAMKTLLATDNAAQLKEYSLKKKWVDAFQDWKKAKAAETVQDTLVKKLDADLKAANTKKLEVDAAKKDADENIAARKLVKVSSDKAYDDKKKAYDAKFKEISPEQVKFDAEQKKLVTEKIAWQWAVLAEKQGTDTKALWDPIVKTNTDVLDSSKTGAAKNVETAKTSLRGSGDPKTSWDGRGTFITELGKMVTAYKEWMELDKTGSGDLVKYFDKTYTSGASGKDCTLATCDVDGGASKTMAECQAECTKKAAWALVEKTPKGTIDATNTYCYGVLHKDDKASCKLCYAKIPVLGGAGSKAGFTCAIRKKADQAKITAIANLYAKVKTGGTEEVKWSGKYSQYWTTYKSSVYPKVYLLDIAISYHEEIKALQTAKDALITTANTGLTAKKTAAFNTYDATNKLMIASRDKVKTIIADTAVLEEAMKNLEYKKVVEDRENVNYQKITTDMDTQQKAVVALIGNNLSGLTKSLADARGVLGASVAAGLLKKTADADGAQKAAKKLYVAQIAEAKKSADAMSVKLKALEKLLGEAKALDDGDVKKAQDNYDNWLKLQVKEAGTVAAKEVLKVGSIVACEALQYNEYAQTLANAVSARKEKIAKIVKLLDDRTAPKKGAAGWRCEKALSNGTFRQARNDKTCADGLCCGAAKLTTGNLVMTIETCQTKTDTKYEYTKPRTPLATTWTKVSDVPFTCISGAQKLVSAASALAAAVYMMA